LNRRGALNSQISAFFALHELAQQRRVISFLDRMDQHPLFEFVIAGICAVSSEPSGPEGLLAKVTSLEPSKSLWLHLKFGRPADATSQNPERRLVLQLGLREKSDCVIM
jgi:hypothetical protein